MARIIMLSGKAGAGKDLAGSILVAMGHTRVAFADALKKVAAELYNYPEGTFHDRGLKDRRVPFSCNPETGEMIPGKIEDDKHDIVEVSPRDLAIQVGAIGRELDPDIWVKLADIPQSNVVVTDWRFPNEHAALVAAGHEVHTIRIVRGGLELSECESETSLDDFDFDYVLPNTGTKGLVARFLGAILGDINERAKAH